MWVRTAIDCQVGKGAVLLEQVVLLASSAGGDVTLYDGIDATNGRKILQVKGAQNVSESVNFVPAERCDHGLYVDVGSNVTEVLVRYSYPDP